MKHARPSQKQSYDAIVIGGGFYGCQIALSLAKRFRRVALLEKHGNLLTRASFTNASRIHHGYHYPRHFATAKSSSLNYQRFLADFPQCIDDSYHALYAISKTRSKISTVAFKNLCASIGAPLAEAPAAIRKLFNPRAVDGIFSVREAVFDANKLRATLEKRLDEAGVQVFYHSDVQAVKQSGAGLRVDLRDGTELLSEYVFNCTYAQINSILHASGLPIIPLKYELAEVALFELPAILRDLSVTIIDGSFFSAMPFPPIGGLHSLTHVTHTPHREWYDHPHAYDPDTRQKKTPLRSNFGRMLKQAERYIPAFAGSQYRGSLFETKTMLPSNELDDGRPILFKKDYGLKNFTIILGAKIDNVYDVVDLLDNVLDAKESAAQSGHLNIVHASDAPAIVASPRVLKRKTASRPT